MATVYQVKIVSDWINYSEEELEKKINEALKKEEKEKGNCIRVKVLERR